MRQIMRTRPLQTRLCFRRVLPYGGYSLVGSETRMAVERESMPDFVSSGNRPGALSRRITNASLGEENA